MCWRYDGFISWGLWLGRRKMNGEELLAVNNCASIGSLQCGTVPSRCFWLGYFWLGFSVFFYYYGIVICLCMILSYLNTFFSTLFAKMNITLFPSSLWSLKLFVSARLLDIVLSVIELSPLPPGVVSLRYKELLLLYLYSITNYIAFKLFGRLFAVWSSVTQGSFTYTIAVCLDTSQS